MQKKKNAFKTIQNTLLKLKLQRICRKITCPNKISAKMSNSKKVAIP